MTATVRDDERLLVEIRYRHRMNEAKSHCQDCAQTWPCDARVAVAIAEGRLERPLARRRPK